MSRIVKALLAQKWGPISMLQGRKMGANLPARHFFDIATDVRKFDGQERNRTPWAKLPSASSVQIRAKFPVGAPKIPNPPIGFQILDFGFRILGFGFRI